MRRFADKVAVITGAGSGIGRALALDLAGRGARLALSDIDAGRVDETVAQCVERGAEAKAYQLDVADRAAVLAHAEQVVEDFGRANLVINNAGVALVAPVLEMNWADLEWVMNIDFWGVVHGTKAFLPHLIASGDGHVVNVSSLNGYLAQPGMSHYCASKFAVRGFTESLRTEMLLERHPVRVSVVHPGGVATSISDNALTAARDAGHEITADHEARNRTYREKLLRLPADKAAAIIVDGVEKGRVRIRVGSDAVLVDRLVRLLPTTAGRIAVALERRMLKAESV
jgi:NAD(P)-dependent dehydrogenase (short-subunit alcohol dehydrogenase family)